MNRQATTTGHSTIAAEAAADANTWVSTLGEVAQDDSTLVSAKHIPISRALEHIFLSL